MINIQDEGFELDPPDYIVKYMLCFEKLSFLCIAFCSLIFI